MPDNSNDPQNEQEPFDELLDNSSSSDGQGGKGMRTVQNHAMINFLKWVRRYHPEVRSLRLLSEDQLFHLVNEFTGGRFTWDLWEVGFSLLLEGHSNKEGYENARETMRQLGLD